MRCSDVCLSVCKLGGPRTQTRWVPIVTTFSLSGQDVGSLSPRTAMQREAQNGRNHKDNRGRKSWTMEAQRGKENPYGLKEADKCLRWQNCFPNYFVTIKTQATSVGLLILCYFSQNVSHSHWLIFQKLFFFLEFVHIVNLCINQ